MQALTTARLTLEPLSVGHADAMFGLLSEPLLYRYLDQAPPASVEQLRGVYARLQARVSPDGTQRWLNWIVRPHAQAPIGFVQATVRPDRAAWVAYLLSSPQWGRGYATEATRAMLDHLVHDAGVNRFLACVEVENDASIRLLGRLGFHAATAHEREAQALSASERLYVG